MTTDKHLAYTKAIRWINGRKVLHRHNQYLNNRMKQDHQHIKQRYYPMLGFAKFESASRFCTAFDKLRNYLRVRTTHGEHAPANARRKIFTNKWSTLMTELSA
jgi:transposase-like protein